MFRRINALLLIIVLSMSLVYAPVYAEDLIVNAVNEHISYNGGREPEGGYLIMFVGTVAEFDVEIEKAGLYRLFIKTTNANGKTTEMKISSGEDILTADITEKHTRVEHEAGLMMLKSGVNRISVKNQSGTWVYFQDLRFSFETDEFKTESVTTNETETSDIVRGTDCLCVNFNLDVDDNAIDKKIKLLDADGKEIKTDLFVENKKVYVRLKETLEYNSTYKICIDDLKDKYGFFSLSDEKVITTLGNENDSGISELVIDSREMEYNVLTVKGNVKSSVGVGISGRKVRLDLLTPTEVLGFPIETVTGEDGEFVLSIEFDEEAPCGIFKMSVSCEYGTETQNFSMEYVSRELEKSAFNQLAASENEDEVKAFFDNYAVAFGLDFDAATAKISNKNIFYGYFKGKSYTDPENFKEDFYDYAALESLNQVKTPSQIGKLLDEGNNIKEIFEIDDEKLQAIASHKMSMYVDVYNEIRFETLEDVKSSFEAIMNKYLITEFNKTDVMPRVSVIELYYSQGAVVPIGIISGDSEICQVEMNVVIDEELSGEIKALSDACTVEKISDTEYLLSYNGNSEKFAEASIIAPGESEIFKLSFSGKIYYKPQDKDFTISTQICNASTDVNVKRNTTSGKVSGGGRTSGGKSTSSGIIGGTNINLGDNPNEESENKNNKDEESEKTTYKFIDLADVSWAEKSIYDLLEKGVISKNEAGVFRPQDNITRAEFVKMIMTAFGKNTGGSFEFNDVAPSAWYYDVVCTAAEEGIIIGSNGMFFPEEKITRQDICVILMRILEKYGFEIRNDDDMFKDDNEISEYAKDSVYTMKFLKVINGTGDNYFEPKNFANRAQAAKIVSEVLKMLSDEHLQEG